MSDVMKRTLRCAVAIAALLGAAPTLRGDAIPVYASGHCDLCADYEDGAMALHYHFHAESPGKDESGNTLVGEYEPASLCTRVSDATKTTMSENPQYAFLGAPVGSNVWVLSQNNVSNQPYLGFGTEELDDEQFPNGVAYKLISASGPGQFSMWMNDAFGNPIEYWATSNGITDKDGNLTDVYAQAALAHSHANWGFTAEGVYTVRMQLSGTPADHATVSSEIETFTFLVGSSTTVPEPGTSCLAAIAIGTLGLATWRKRPRSRR